MILFTIDISLKILEHIFENIVGVSGFIFEKHFSNSCCSSGDVNSIKVVFLILPGNTTLRSILGKEFELVNNSICLFISSSIIFKF